MVYGPAHYAMHRGCAPPSTRLCINHFRLKREHILISKNTSRHGHHFAHQCLCFLEAPYCNNKGVRVVVRCQYHISYSKGIFVYLAQRRAVELQTSEVYVSSHIEGLFKSSELLIRVRKIALHHEQVFF